jgi:hypothetical protein
MKDPVGIFGWRRGFSVQEMRAMRIAGTNTALRDSLTERGSLMPPWMEILLNVIGYAGFIGVATYHKPSDENSGER